MIDKPSIYLLIAIVGALVLVFIGWFLGPRRLETLLAMLLLRCLDQQSASRLSEVISARLKEGSEKGGESSSPPSDPTKPLE